MLQFFTMGRVQGQFVRYQQCSVAVDSDSSQLLLYCYAPPGTCKCFCTCNTICVFHNGNSPVLSQ